MNDFQVGDRVSIEGVVTQLWPDAKPGPLILVEVTGDRPDEESELWFPTKAVTLVERPKRKLRVGSVWECGLAGRRTSRFVVVGADELVCLEDGDTSTRGDLTLDSKPNLWREVPVEELEREAQ